MEKKRQLIVDSLGPCVMMNPGWMGNPRTLFAPGNGKLGNIINWSLPASRTHIKGRTFITCPGQSSWCRTHCYAQKGRFEFGGVKAKYLWNLKQSFLPNFVDRAIQELKHSSSPYVRIHVSGDFYSPAYARKWKEIIAACPEKRFYAYTRTWRVPALFNEVRNLDRFSNMTLLLSTDESTGAPLPGWKEAGIDHPYHANAQLCRHQETGVTCDQCLLCWEKSGHVWFKYH